MLTRLKTHTQNKTKQISKDRKSKKEQEKRPQMVLDDTLGKFTSK